MIKILVCVACMLLIVSCGGGSGLSSSGGVRGKSNPPPGDFLYTSNSEAMFLSWVNNNGALSGQTQDAQYEVDRNGYLNVNSIHGSFTGMLSNGQVNLNFGGFLGYTSNITGTYDGNMLTLNIPTTDGNIGSFVFMPATVNDFNIRVSTMQTTTSNNNATATTKATADANAANQQQAVTNANQAVASDLSALQSDISSLNQNATFDSVFASYASDWKQMQNDYQTEVNDSKNGCANGNNGTVQGDAGTMQGDNGTIQGDDGTFDGQKASIDAAYGNVQRDIGSLKNDWQALQQAVANNPSGTPPSSYRQSDIDNAIMSGNNALSNADSVVKKAKQDRTTYDNKANSLNSKAQAIPGNMGC